MIAPIVGALGSIFAPLVVLILFLVLAKGSARTLGSVGSLLILLDSLGWFVSSWVLPGLIAGFSLYDSAVSTSVYTVVRTALYGVGLILLARAVIVGRGRTA